MKNNIQKVKENMLLRSLFVLLSLHLNQLPRYIMHYIAKYNFFFCKVSIILLHRKVINKTSIFRVKKKRREEMKNHTQKVKESILLRSLFVLLSLHLNQLPRYKDVS